MIINCKRCGKEKKVYPCNIKAGRGIYCSNDCKHKDRKGKTAEEIYKNPQKTLRNQSLTKKGKTHIEIFGEEEAKKRKKQILQLIKNQIGKKRPDVTERWKKLRGPINLNISSKELQRLRKHGRYKAWRKKIFEKFDCCVDCGSKENLEADHIIPIFQDKSKIFDEDNGKLRCKKCHIKKTRKEYWEAEKRVVA